MGGNKHKNGIVCVFPGCAKTMRTQKFKIHFSKQHLKPGELYTVEHRRRFEVARDDDGSCSPPPVSASPAAATTTPPPPPPLPPTGAGSDAAAVVAVKVAVPPVAAPVLTLMLPAALHSSLTPQFSPLGADSALGSSLEETVASNTSSISRVVDESAELLSSQVGAALTRSAAVRFGGSTASPVIGVKRQAPEQALAPETPNTVGPTERTRASSSPSLAGTTSVPIAAASGTELQDAVLAQFIGMLDVRFRELIQKMDQVIDGQHEIVELLRRPFSIESGQLGVEHPPLLSPADSSGRKRRRGGASEHDAGGGGTTSLL